VIKSYERIPGTNEMVRVGDQSILIFFEVIAVWMQDA